MEAMNSCNLYSNKYKRLGSKSDIVRRKNSSFSTPPLIANKGKIEPILNYGDMFYKSKSLESSSTCVDEADSWCDEDSQDSDADNTDDYEDDNEDHEETDDSSTDQDSSSSEASEDDDDDNQGSNRPDIHLQLNRSLSHLSISQRSAYQSARSNVATDGSACKQTATEDNGCFSVVSPTIPSLFEGGEPSINFCLEGERAEMLPLDTRRLLKWRSSTITPNVIKRCLHRTGFRITKSANNWIGYWGKHMKSDMFKTVKEFQKVNHFPGSFQIGRKDRLWRNISRMQACNGRSEFNFVPQTYILPQDLKHLKQVWDDSGKQKWILKPPASARGNGIKVINRWNQVPKKKPVLVQKYLGRPYLINGCKFDLRVYAYVTAVDPLRIYIFDDGLVRFCTVKYSSSIKFLSNRFMHLTNYSINKFNQDFTPNDDCSACQGHKWSLKALWDFMKTNGINTNNIWDSIKDIVIKSIICCEPSVYSLMKAAVKRAWSCHELFGFDIILDDKLKPWLLEVNISPSLHSSSSLDRDIKGVLVRDLLNLACFRIPEKKIFQTSNDRTLLRSNCERRFTYNHLSADEKAKHLFYVQKHLDEHSRSTILDILTSDDIRVLMEMEDEYNKRGRFERVFPSVGAQYDKFFEQPRYYNILAGEWYRRYYGNYHDRGIALLQTYCCRGWHLQKERTGGTQWRSSSSLVMKTLRRKSEACRSKESRNESITLPEIARKSGRSDIDTVGFEVAKAIFEIHSH